MAMSNEANISRLAAQHEVSRKFVYQQKDKAQVALNDAFAATAPDDTVLFNFPVTKTWLNQLTVSLTLICHSSYRGVVELMRDLLGVSISEGSVHNLHQVAIERAGTINKEQKLSAIRHALLDEIFHCNQPVLAGIDARSTYCFLLAAEPQRDSETWAIHHMYAKDQGFNPDYAIADAGTGLRAGFKLIWKDKRCHGDVFHIQHLCEDLSNTLIKMANGATTGRQKIQDKGTKGLQHGQDHEVMMSQALALEAQAHTLARDVKTLTQWLGRDVLALAGPSLAIRVELFDFVITELLAREHLDPKRIHPVRVALQNQRNDLLAFAGVLDGKLEAIPFKSMIYKENKFILR